MNATRLNLLSKLKDLQATSETLLEVAIYLETASHTSKDEKNLKRMADKCRQGIASIDIIL